MLLLHQIILDVSEKIFSKKYKNYLQQLMIRLEVKNYNMVLTQKQKKYQHYHLEKLINIKFLQVKK